MWFRNFKWAAIAWLSVGVALAIAYPLVFSTTFQQRLGALVLLYAIAAVEAQELAGRQQPSLFV